MSKSPPACLGLFLSLSVLIVWLSSARAADEPTYKGKTVSVWIEATKDPDPRTRERAVLVLRKLGPATKAVVPALIEIVRVGDPRSGGKAYQFRYLVSQSEDDAEEDRN